MSRDNIFGNQLRTLRKSNNLSQYQLGYLLGVSDRAVSKWENGLTRPKSAVLVKLCELFDITSDELLGVRVDNNLKFSTIAADYERFWSKTDALLQARFGYTPSLEVLSRYEKEKIAISNTYLPQYFSLLLLMKTEARRCLHDIEVLGGIGASFVAYIIGVTDINPLPPHYYCPICKTTDFVTSIQDGWDLPFRTCSCCSSVLLRDGHNIPFEVYSHSINRNIGFDVIIDHLFYADAERLIMDSLGNFSLKIINNPNILYKEKIASNAVTFVINPDSHYRTVDKVKENITYAEYSQLVSNRSYINLISDDAFDKYVALRNKVNLSYDVIDYCDQSLYSMLLNSNIIPIPNFLQSSFKRLAYTNHDVSFSNLVQLFGITLIMSEYPNVVSNLHSDKPFLHKLIVYRDDMFHLICSKLRERDCFEPAIAYTMMNEIRKGQFFRNDINEVSYKLLENVGFSNEEIALLRRTPCLFPKSLGLIYLKRALTLMWYQKFWPKEFRQVFGD